MRLWSWLKPQLASARNALAGYRLNPRALVFGCACALVWSGVRHWSPPAARIALGLILFIGLVWPEGRREKSP